jgi:micrococcal nuclease
MIRRAMSRALSCLGLAAALLLSAAAPAQAEPVVVKRVVDGDTVVLADGSRVRVIGINTPEKGEPLSDEAAAFTRALCEGKPVEVLVGPVPKDGYGRTLGDIKVGGKTVAEGLVEKGLAHVYLVPPFDAKAAARLGQAQARARKGAKGIWATERYRGDFHITSFHANAPGDDRNNVNGEYLRVANISGEPRSLKGYTLHDADRQVFALPDLVVPPAHTVRIHSGKGQDARDPAQALALYVGSDRPLWNNDADSAILKDPKGQLVDRADHPKAGVKKTAKKPGKWKRRDAPGKKEGAGAERAPSSRTDK